MPITPKRLPFFDHIAELRRRIVVIAVTIIVLSMVLYTWAWQIYLFVLGPVLPLLKSQPTIFGPFGTFGLRFQVAFYASLVIGAPVIIWQIMAFFLPALKPKERKYVVPTFAAAVLLFGLGLTFCYTIIMNVGFKWILDQGGTAVQVIPDAQKFFEGVILLLLGFGAGFELPIVVFYLVIFNIVPYAKLREQWRVVYVVLMFVASAATPDWSPTTMGGLFVALGGLYELSMLLARVVLRKRIAAQKKAELALFGEDDSDDNGDAA
jgi:sec-independent protein translocase protein TatC